MIVLGLRSPKNRSLLSVNEDFEGELNDKISLLDKFLFHTHSFVVAYVIDKLNCKVASNASVGDL